MRRAKREELTPQYYINIRDGSQDRGWAHPRFLFLSRKLKSNYFNASARLGSVDSNEFFARASPQFALSTRVKPVCFRRNDQVVASRLWSSLDRFVTIVLDRAGSCRKKLEAKRKKDGKGKRKKILGRELLTDVNCCDILSLSHAHLNYLFAHQSSSYRATTKIVFGKFIKQTQLGN